MRDLDAGTSERVRRDYHALRESAALLDLSGWTVLRLEGADAGSFLDGIASQDLRAVPPGQARPTLFLTEKGKPVALAWVAAEAGGASALVIADEGARATLRPHLERFRIMESVEFAGPAGMPLLVGVGGPSRDGLARSVAARLEGAVVLSAEPMSFILARGPIPAETSEAAAYESWRIAVGLPRTGIDFDESRIATELALPQAISLTKGCYVGQETVARTTGRGRVRRQRVGFRFSWTGAPIAPGTELRAGGVAAGYVTSSAPEPGSGEGLGMGYCSGDAVAPGLPVLAVEGPATTHLQIAPWPL